MLNKINENFIEKYFNVKPVNFLPLLEYEKTLKNINENLYYECFKDI
ncbi:MULTISPECIES: hypothetical protein [unclassified Campylobacter]|nr:MULTISPECIES: hypothetical protein [unclassified Campylobacter]